MVIAHFLLPLMVAVSIVLMLARPYGIAEVWWISGGALLLIALRLVPLKLAGQAVAKGTDVYLFLTGMMLLSELAREQGVFDWVASTAVRGAQGSCSRLFLLVYSVGTLVTIFMSNDATAVVLTPAILAAVRKAKVRPLPYLFVCALIANAASFVLPISNPANLVVFHTGMPPLGRWLADFGVPSLLSIVVTFAVLRILFRDELRDQIECEVEDAKLSGNGKLVLAGLALMIAVLLTASAMKKDLGLPTCLAALLITAVVSTKARSNPLQLAREISWGTLLLVAGLFVMVDAVESQGALKLTQQWLTWAAGLGPNYGHIGRGICSGYCEQSGEQPAARVDSGGDDTSSPREGIDCECSADWGRPGAESLRNRLACDDPLATRAAQGFFPRRSRGEARCQLLEISKGGCSCHAGGAACGPGRGRLDAPGLTHRAIRVCVRSAGSN